MAVVKSPWQKRREEIARESKDIPKPTEHGKREFFTMLGFAVFWAQSFEGNLHSVVSLLHIDAKPLTLEHFEATGEKFRRDTLGKLLVRLREKVGPLHHLEEELKLALDLRNELTHRFVVKHHKNFDSERGRRKAINELRQSAIALKKMTLEMGDLMELLVRLMRS